MTEMTKDELYARLNKAEAFIAREGYRSCSAAACNCGSWHGGRAWELYAEIREVVQEAGVKTNGVLFVDALRDALARMAGPDEVVVPGYTDDETTIIRMCKTPGELEQLFDAGLRHKSGVQPRNYLRAWLNIARMFGYATKDDFWGELEKLLMIVFRRMVMAERAARPNQGGNDDQAK